MTDVAGVYEVVTKTPMGDQKGTLTLIVDGDTVTGQQEGALGTMDVENGKVDGSTVTWESNMTVPMPMKLDVVATIDGDTIEGTVKAGAFGDMPMTGVRKS